MGDKFYVYLSNIGKSINSNGIIDKFKISIVYENPFSCK